MNRALASMDAADPRYPNLHRYGQSRYKISQQESYVKQHPGLFNGNNVTRNINRMHDFADNQYEKRRNQIVSTANKMLSALAKG